MSNQQHAHSDYEEWQRSANFGQAYTYSVNAQDDEEVEVDLAELFAAVIQKFWLILLTAIVCGAAGYLISRFCIAETFESTTRIYVLDKSDTGQSTYNDLQTGSQLTNDYAEIITSRAVLEQVMSDNNLLEVYTYDTFAGKVDIDVPDSTRIVSITVTDTDPAMAQKLADDIRTVASELIIETMQIDAVNTFEEANYPTVKAGPNNTRNALIAAVIGAALVIVIIVIRFILDDTVKTSEDVERYLRLSTLALIPLDEGVGADPKTMRRRGSRPGQTHHGRRAASGTAASRPARNGASSGLSQDTVRQGADGKTQARSSVPEDQGLEMDWNVMPQDYSEAGDAVGAAPAEEPDLEMSWESVKENPASTEPGQEQPAGDGGTAGAADTAAADISGRSVRDTAQSSPEPAGTETSAAASSGQNAGDSSGSPSVDGKEVC